MQGLNRVGVESIIGVFSSWGGNQSQGVVHESSFWPGSIFNEVCVMQLYNLNHTTDSTFQAVENF